MMKQLHTMFVLMFVCCSFLGMTSSDIINLQDEPIAIVRKFKPTVSVQNQQTEKDIILDLKADIGEKLYSGDTLRTDEEGYALVMFMDESIAKVKPLSMLVVRGEVSNKVKSMNTRIDLQDGEIFLNVQPQGTSDFEVATSRSLASVKGTEFGGTSQGYIWVKEGQVDLTALNSGETVSLFDKMFGSVDNQGNTINTGTLTDEELNDLDEGYEEVENDLKRKVIKFRFRDQNGQIREIEIDVFEEGQE